MAKQPCNYEIKLRGGESIILPSSLTSKSDFNFNELRTSLNDLDKNLLKDIFDKITGSSALPILASSINLGNVIKTTSLNKIQSQLSTNNLNEIESELYLLSKNLIVALDEKSEDLSKHNIIYTDLYKYYTPNYGNVYDVENDTFIINSDQVGNINFIPLNKGLIDMYILKHSKIIRDLISDDFKSVKEFVENMPYLYRKGKVSSDIINAIKSELNISDSQFDYIYSLHSYNINKDYEKYIGNTKEELRDFAEYTFNKYKDVFREKESYYLAADKSKDYPLLKVGDLIKYKSNFKYGTFGIYLNHYDIDGNRFYTILQVNSDGKGYRFQNHHEDDVKFNDEFVVMKNITSDYSRTEFDVNTPIVKITNPLYISSPDKEVRLSSELMYSLKPGDQFERGYRNTDGTYGKLLEEVIEVKGNNITSRIPRLGAKAYTNPIGKHFVLGVKFNLDNHPELTSFDSKEFRVNREFNKLSTKLINITDDNKEDIFSKLTSGDIIVTQMQNGSGYFYNYYLGNINDNKVSIIYNDNGVYKSLSLDKSEIKGVVFDTSKNSENINKFINNSEIISKSIDIDILSKSNSIIIGKNADLNKNFRYSVFNVDNTYKKSYDLKTALNSNDIVVINGNTYLVLENNFGKLRLFNKSGVYFDTVEKVEKIIKPEMNPTIYTEKSIQMNTPLVDSKFNLESKFGFEKDNLIDMVYVLDSQFKDSYEWKNGEVRQATWMDKNMYDSKIKDNPNRFIDLTKQWATNNISSGIQPTGVKINNVLLNNIKGCKTFNIKGMTIDDFLNNISVGSYITLDGSYRTLRVEECSNNGILVSYTFKDKNGKLSEIQQELTKDDFKSENYNHNIFIPLVQTKTLEKFKEFSTSSSTPIQNTNSSEVLNNISEFISKKFGINVFTGTTNDFRENDNLKGVEEIERAKSFIHNGIIYINSDFTSLNDPVHELIQLILGSFKVLNPKVYENLISRMDTEEFEDEYNYVQNNYPNTTHYEILEETLSNVLSKMFVGKLESNILSDDIVQNAIQNTINEIFQLTERNNDVFDMVSLPLNQLLFNFGSSFVNNPESLYDKDASIIGGKITTLKRYLMKNNQLTEECK